MIKGNRKVVFLTWVGYQSFYPYPHIPRYFKNIIIKISTSAEPMHIYVGLLVDLVNFTTNGAGASNLLDMA